MKKKALLSIFLSVFIVTGMLHTHTLFAGSDDDANKYYLDAYNLYKLGKLDESMDMLKKVVEMKSDHAEAHFGMGSIYFRQNRFDDAVKSFTKVTRIKPEYVEAYQRLWLAYKKLGMNDKAEAELMKYKKLIEDRMRAMTGGSPQVVRPAAPPRKEEPEVESKPRQTREETKVVQPRPAEPKVEKPPAVVKPVTPRDEEERRRSVVETPRSPVVEAPKPLVVQPIEPSLKTRPAVEPPKVYTQIRSQPPPPPADTESPSHYIKVDRDNPAYRHLFKPFNKARSFLFQNHFKKITDKLKGLYIGKFFQGFLYYIFGIQVWLCVVASLCFYFRKAKKQE